MGISMAAKRRLTTVLVFDVEGCRHGGRMAAPRILWVKRLVSMWSAVAVVLVVSIGGLAAQSKSGKVADQPKKILLLHTFGPNFEQGAAWNREIQRELNRQSPWPLNIQDQSLITAIDGDSAAEAKFVEYLGTLYAQQAPDLIVALGAPAARFVQQHKTDMFPKTPMLLAAVEVRRIEPSLLSEQDAVAGVRYDQVTAIENVLRLLPETKAIAIILGNSPGERFWAGEHRRVLGPLLKDKVELIFYGEQPLNEILRDVANLPPHTAIFFQQLVVDGAGGVYGDKEPLKRIADVANAPIFSFDETYFNGQIVGGPMFSPAKGAQPMAAVAIRMLAGEKTSGIDPIGFSTPKYDWRQLQRWNISESRLPPGSEILFREQTLWERYWWQIALTIAVILLQAGLILALLREHRRRQFAEVQSRQRMTELAHVNRFATAGELTASIAHEINQPLGSILTNAETAEAILKSQEPDIAALPDIVELRAIVSDILHDDRRASQVIHRMRSLLKKAPFELKKFDLNEVVQETIRLFSSLSVGRKFELVSVITPGALPVVGDRIQLQQVILNFVMNGLDAMRDTPSENRIITIRTSRVENFAELSVSDRGSGIPEEKLKEVFDPFFTTKAEGMGMGLSIARTIVEAHKGVISAKNRDHGGASFRIRLPLV
jgi:signal transduction histidine kinase